MVVIDPKWSKRIGRMKREGAIALQWQTVVRPDSPLECIIRQGLIYSLSLEPIGHAILIDRLPPQNLDCSCILVPLLRMPRQGDIPSGSFEEWLAGCTESEQDRLLGKVLGKLWRRGEIRKDDLVDAKGSLRELGVR